MKKDAVGANLDKTAELERKKEKRALPKVRLFTPIRLFAHIISLSLLSHIQIWMKVVYEYKAKIMPIKEGMQWVDFVDMLTQEFGIRAWNVWHVMTLVTARRCC